jgi:ankyrin repeat protein
VKEGMARDIFGWTPFHYAAARAGLQFSDSNEDVNDASGETTRILETLKRFLETNPPTGWWLDNFNRSPVHIAAFSGNNGLLKELLDALPSRDAELAMTIGGPDGMKPLHLAAGRRKVACVTTLLDDIRSGIEIEVDVWKQSPIHTALVNHSYDCARQLSYSKNFYRNLETLDGFGRPLFFYLLGEAPKEKKLLGAEILEVHWEKFEAQHGDKQSFLHLAISFLHVKQLRKLIYALKSREGKQPDVDLVNKYGETPLHLAVQDKKFDLVECLVNSFGASPSVKNNNQLSPMMLACDIGDLSLVQTMCQAQKYLGAEVDGQGRTALHHAILNTKWSVDGCAQAVKLLAGVMVNVDALDQNGCSPLHYAVDTCNVVAFSILQEFKASIDLTDKSKRNLLHHAVLSVERNPDRSNGNLIDSICKEISKPAIDARDDKGQTPLHLAIISDNDETAFFLLSKDANPQIENIVRMTPFMTACQFSSCQKFIKYAVEQSNMLKSNVNKNQPITQDGSSNNAYRDGIEVKSTKSDVNPHFKDFDINKVDSSRNLSALGWACCGGSVEVVEILLLAKTVSLKIQATRYLGFTPLHLALYRNNQDIVQRLVADPRVISSLGIADDHGLTPIDFAIRKSNEGCLRPLLEHPNVGPERFSSSQLEEIMDKYRHTKSRTMAWHEWVTRAEAGRDISFPFHGLAKAGLRKEVEELLQFYMNAFELDEDKWTPADVAQWCGHVDLMHYLRDRESKGDFIRPPYRWPSTFFDLYDNSTLETTTCPSLNSSPRLTLGQKQRFIIKLY